MRGMGRRRQLLALVVTGVLLAACSTAPDAEPRPRPEPSGASSPGSGTPSGSPSAVPEPEQDPVSLPALAGIALLAGLATALLETGWYALTSGVSPWLVFQANADILTYWDYASIRPAHWVALAGLAVAVAHAWRARKPRARRQARQAVTA